MVYTTAYAEDAVSPAMEIMNRRMSPVFLHYPAGEKDNLIRAYVLCQKMETGHHFVPDPMFPNQAQNVARVIYNWAMYIDGLDLDSFKFFVGCAARIDPAPEYQLVYRASMVIPWTKFLKEKK